MKPEVLDTKFFAYRDSDPNTGLLVDPEAPDTFKVVDAKRQLAFIVHGLFNK